MTTWIGGLMLRLVDYLGGLVLLATESTASIFSGRIRWRLVLNQLLEIGYRSQTVVIVTGVFTGAVFTAQTFFLIMNCVFIKGICCRTGTIYYSHFAILIMIHIVLQFD